MYLLKTKRFFGNPARMAKVATILVFIGLLRTLAEPIRLRFQTTGPPPFAVIEPLIMGSLIAAAGLLVMTLLFYFRKYILVICTCIVVIAVMVMLKKIYLLP